MDAFALMLHDTLSVTALISLPVLLVATLVGTTIALVQAVTQVQEQTLTVLPKFLIVGACIVAGAHFAMQMLVHLLQRGVDMMPMIVRAS